MNPNQSNLSEKKIIATISAISAVIFIILIWVIYIKEKPTLTSPEWAWVTPLNALLNSFSATALTFGFLAIKKGKIQTHKKWMLTALGASTLFLIGYLAYHSIHPDAVFLGKGSIRPIYFFILISHIALTVVGLPFILITFAFALLKRFESHKKIARITWPAWMYISITGILIYLIRVLAAGS